VTVVCGVDVGSLATESDVAWLRDGRFVLARYVASAEQPLPRPPDGWEAAGWTALDAPQGLPQHGRARRAADRDANTPTRVLPVDRAGLASLRAYGAFVRAGIELFWSAHERGLPVLETYPRFVIRRLWPELAVPSKRREPRRYVAELWARLRLLGLAGPRPTTHHEIDAVLCALAAAAWVDGSAIAVGEPAWPDVDERVLREGTIVAPRGPAEGAAGLDVSALLALQAATAARATPGELASWPPERAMDEHELAAFLERRSFCVLATSTPRGRPQARPVAYTYRDGAFWFASVGGARLRNLRAEPWASLVVEEGDRGDHRMVLAEGPVDVHAAAPPAVAEAWERRHGSRAEWAAAWLELRPHRVFSHRP